MRKLTPELQEAFNELVKTNSENFRTYSGRGMYGEQCIGVDGSNREIREFLSNAAQELLQSSFDVAYDAGVADDAKEEDANAQHDKNVELLQTLLNYEEDSMGRGVIIYWPRVKYIKTDSDRAKSVEDDDFEEVE